MASVNPNQLTASNFAHSRLFSHPIQRLCPEILTEIFTFCHLLDVPREAPYKKYISSRRAPLLLCSVCSSWRSLVVSTPHLWQKFYFFASFEEGLTIDTESILRGIRSWLDRSRALPLFICVVFFGIKRKSYKAPKCRQIFQMLLQEISRWKSFELHDGELFDSSHFGIFPMLHSLDISNTFIRGIPFASAPCLKRLKLYSLPQPMFISAFAWDQLVALTVVVYQTISTAIEIIQRCPRLEQLSLAVEKRDEDMLSSFRPTVTHNILRELCLDLPYLSAVLDRLTLPALKDLALDVDRGIPQVEGQLHSNSQLIDFFTRSSCELQKFRFHHPSNYGPGELLECLSHQSFQTLSCLVIGGRTTLPPLINGELLIRLTYPDDDENVPLCPKLNELELYYCTGSDKLFHQLLGKMVHSRCFGRPQADKLKLLQICTQRVASMKGYELLFYAKKHSGLKLHYQHPIGSDTDSSDVASGEDTDEDMYEDDEDAEE